MTAVMIQGCTSWAGKSLLTTALCRWYARQGLRVAPFKAQNMSNNARVVAGGEGASAARRDGASGGGASAARRDGASGGGASAARRDGASGEIGVAQWLQARAAGLEPDVRMNPVLLKPERGGSQVVRLGQVDHELSRRPWHDRSEALWPTVDQALGQLLDEYDLVVIEGAGSPAEINLAANDIVNMRVAERADAPVLLAVDIDRGGAFAHLYGTWALLPQRHRERIRGFVLNRFRGDASLLPPGPEQLEQLTGVPTVGVVPMVRHDLPDEDGAALHAPRRGGLPPVAVVRHPAASNLDEFALLEQVADVRWATAPWHLDGAATVILPGSKHVSADLDWLRASGLDDAVRAAAARPAVRVVGVCGGLQLLGRRLVDPHGVDGSGYGLGLLPLTTTYAPDKLVRHRTLRLPSLSGSWRGLAGLQFDGYEIRQGRTVADGPLDAAVDDALVVARGNVLGCYLHGMFEHPAVLEALFGARPDRTLDDTFDLLADIVEHHVDGAVLRELAGLP